MAARSITLERFTVYWVGLDPTVGREIQKTRPCVIISPLVLNQLLGTVIVAPLTSQPKGFPCRVPVRIQQVKGEVALDQMRCIDKTRLMKPLGYIGDKAASEITRVLVEMFDE